ncbi:ATP-binding protein [Anaerobacillus sp. CMMVII]|uniref:ATP-binding protein n=1 Tax=Anaerobacillus sp. CMMVII TaxID=2755588 RepID=UPI0021B7AFD4|nr:ATP-binding protein [Anaerobacillus sp. CMMVII]
MENSEKLSLVGQLSASIAHEIRNPLTTLKGFLQLIKSQGEFTPTYIDLMLSEMDRIESITSELLLLAKPQAIEFQEENMKDIIFDVVTLLQSQALMKNVEIIFLYEEVGSIYCVSSQMKQVFINIIKNAIEAMSEAGVIYVRLTNLDKYYILIEVIDEGCGIPEELASNIGLPFYSTKEKGTGLGMLTTYKLVNDHGGTITFDSKVGEGTTFKIQLPRKTLKMGI